MDNKRFKEILDSPNIAREFFLPSNLAYWQNDRYTLGKGDPRQTGTQIAGVRLLERDHLKPDTIKDCQYDVSTLVQSIIHLRNKPELAGVVLSNECVRATHAGAKGGKRLKFGLNCPPDAYLDDSAAAGECHKQIDRAIRKSGFVVEQPRGFDAQTGMAGLLEWAGRIELQRQNYPSPLWLLLLLLLLPLLCFLPWKCAPPSPFYNPESEVVFGIPVKTESFLILFDKSSSMEKCFPFARAEAKRFLNARLKNSKGKCYGDIIYYDKDAYPVLGSIDELTDKTADKLARSMDDMKPGGGTNLQSAIDLAADEAQKHGKETTLLIITDADDPSVPRMLADVPGLKKKFGSVKVTANSTSPRHFMPAQAPPSPNDLMLEKQLKDFSTALGGSFGPQ